MASISLKNYQESSIVLGESVTVICSDLDIGTYYSLDTEYSDGSYGSFKGWSATDTEMEWTATPMKIGWFTITLYEDDVAVGSLMIMVQSGGGGGGEEPDPDEIPDAFYWIDRSTDLEAGMVISDYITAEKWKELQDNVNAVRVYMGLSKRSFTTVSKGERIRATYYNQIRNAINSMVEDEDDEIPRVRVGDPITAEVMMLLQETINDIG